MMMIVLLTKRVNMAIALKVTRFIVITKTGKAGQENVGERGTRAGKLKTKIAKVFV
jgi:transcriptional regulator GlxA family with amidase domain